MSASLTPDILRQFIANIEAEFCASRSTPTIFCHPVDAPFMAAMFNGKKDFYKIERLWSECKRKYFMGSKRDIAKWQLRPLVAQYEAKLAAL